MKIFFRLALAFLIIFSLIACQTTTIQPKKLKSTVSQTPDYEKSHDFFIGGLIGEGHVPVDKICKGKTVLQMQSQTTFLDSLWPVLIGLGSIAIIASGLVLINSLKNSSNISLGVNPQVAITLFGLVTPFTALIYTPKTSKVWCEKGSYNLVEAI